MSVSLQSWLHVITKPNSPSTPNLVNISYHCAAINWKPPSKIAVGAIVLDYHVKYVMMNHFGNKTILGSEMVQESRNKTFINLRGLSQGTTYGISVQVIYFSTLYLCYLDYF